ELHNTNDDGINVDLVKIPWLNEKNLIEVDEICYHTPYGSSISPSIPEMAMSAAFFGTLKLSFRQPTVAYNAYLVRRAGLGFFSRTLGTLTRKHYTYVYIKCALPETLTASVGRFAAGLYWRLILLQGYICFLLHLEYIMDNILPAGDPRVESWPLMDNPTPVFFIVLLYLTFVLWLGPKFMRKHQTPFQLRPLMVTYNIFLVLFSAWLVYEFAVSGWLTGYTLGCQHIDRSRRPIAIRMANACWFFFITKIIELFDTVLFILRRKFELVSFLHVFHHAIMPISWWFGVKYVPGGLGTFHAFLNSIVHFFMYTYYGLAAAGPRFQKYIWWKKYVLHITVYPTLSLTFQISDDNLLVLRNVVLVHKFWRCVNSINRKIAVIGFRP
ncbi:Elongation of very long chain fatty acids protein isoform 1, partial [Schistosoma japonicum]